MMWEGEREEEGRFSQVYWVLSQWCRWLPRGAQLIVGLFISGLASEPGPGLENRQR